MGLFGRKRKHGVRGTARVVSTTHAPQATHGSLKMTIVVEAPGIPAFSHRYSKFGARVDKWPEPGDVVPVEVDPDDPSEVEVLWDEVPSTRDVAAHGAEQLAALLRQQQAAPGAPAPPPPSGVADMVSQLQQMFPGAVVNVGTDAHPGDPSVIGTSGVPDPPGGVNVVASRSDADPVERLEKLAKLRDSGIVDDAQFQQLRAQILGQAGLDSA